MATNLTASQDSFSRILETNFANDAFISMLDANIRGKLARGVSFVLDLDRPRDTSTSTVDLGYNADYFKAYVMRAMNIFPLAFLTDEFKEYVINVVTQAASDYVNNGSTGVTDLAARMNGQA